MTHHFSESLQIVKKTLKVNNQQLADLLNVHSMTISRWVNQVYLPPARKRVLIHEQLKQLIREVS